MATKMYFRVYLHETHLKKNLFFRFSNIMGITVVYELLFNGRYQLYYE